MHELVASTVAESRPSSPGVRTRRRGKTQDEVEEVEKELLLEPKRPISESGKTASLWTSLWTLKLPLYDFNVNY
jgi:hypothetical protein